MFGRGAIMAEDDAMHERRHLGTVTCKSGSGLLYVMNIDNFFKKLKANLDTWQQLGENVLIKDKTFNSRLRKGRREQKLAEKKRTHTEMLLDEEESFAPLPDIVQHTNIQQ